QPKGMSGDPDKALSSMGNYIFNTDALVNIMEDESLQDPSFDFGKSILPDIHKRMRVYAYDFSTNQLPGSKSYEENGYWRDVGTLRSYYDANMDILGQRPKLNLNNRRWFIHSGRFDGPPAKIVDGKLSNCIIGDGCFVRNATIKNSILGRGVHVHEGALIEDSIVMDFCKVRAEACLRRAIIDRFNDIPKGAQIGGDPERDAKKYHVDPSGLVIVPRGRTTRLASA
ncbi:MAG: glucose-1-phosphate adenylyltransferase, partial [Elusimicrobia bacterium]|nr:glucose-1-phosphate adenylyltransferase [Elusimicrobiota bacterium]